MTRLTTLLTSLLVLSGCVKRTISITREQNGALVWVNDREVGRTPVELAFLYYGEYDLRVELDGYEPVMGSRWAKSPAWDVPVLDIIAESFSSNLESWVVWHFVREQRNDDSQLLLSRARDLRTESTEEDAK